MIKVVAPMMAQQVIDRAIQVRFAYNDCVLCGWRHLFGSVRIAESE